ncbi:MAG: RHS repeat-associated core domain-containing protein, partial [bacterium]|nr:RHS repeat-associated core domain-containing protein [bacterium]
HQGQSTRYEVYYEYDVYNRLCRIADNLDTILRAVDYGTRMDDRAITITDVALGTVTMGYDGLARIKVIKEDLSGKFDQVSTFSYDNLDRIREEKEENKLTNVLRLTKTEYDTALHGIGRVARQEVKQSDKRGNYVKLETFTYDNFGLPAAVNHNWEVQWSPLEVKQSLALQVEYVHNARKGGRLEKVIFPTVEGIAAGTLQYAYDERSGLLVGLKLDGRSLWKVGENNFTSRGQIRDTILGNGISTSYSYHTNTGLTKASISKRGDKTLLEYRLDHDTAGNVKRRSVNIAGGKTVLQGSYTYDEKNRLVSAIENNRQQHFNYSANGSRLHFSSSNKETSYAYQGPCPHRVTSLSGADRHRLTYDGAGNLSSHLDENSGYSRQLTWDPGNKLSGIRFLDPAQKQVRQMCYGYGPTLERVMLYDDRDRRLVFYVDDHFEVEYRNGSVTVRTHVANDKRRIVTVERKPQQPERFHYFRLDHLESVMLVTGDNAGVESTACYEPFGNITGKSGEYRPDVLFTGQRADVVNFQGFSLYDYGARMYDPHLGIFISPDKVEDTNNAAFGLNRYIYVNNNPLSKYDPFGTEGQSPGSEKNKGSFWYNPLSWPGKVVDLAGKGLSATKIPLVKNLGNTMQSGGKFLESPATFAEGVVTLDKKKIANSGNQALRGSLGLVGLEKAVMGKTVSPGDKGTGVTGGLKVPGHYARIITEAKKEWKTYSKEERNRDYSHGMKKWHTLSNAKITSEAGITEIPWIFIGGIIHEIDPGGVKAEVSGPNAQGFPSWVVDTPGDIVANTLGIAGGLLLPGSLHKDYAKHVGNIVPGPKDPFEDK